MLLLAVVQFDHLCTLLQAWWLHSIVSLFPSRLPSAGDRTTGVLWFLAQLIAARMLLPKLAETKMRALWSHLAKSLSLRPLAWLAEFFVVSGVAVFNMSCQSGCNSGHVCAFLLCVAGSFNGCLEFSVESKYSAGPPCILQISQHCSHREYGLCLFLRVCNDCCCRFATEATGASVCLLATLLRLLLFPRSRALNSQCTSGTCWIWRTRRFRWQVGLLCVVGNSNKLAEVAGSLDLLTANVWSEELHLVWRPVRKTGRDLLDDGLLDDLGRVHLNSVGLERALR